MWFEFTLLLVGTIRGLEICQRSGCIKRVELLDEVRKYLPLRLETTSMELATSLQNTDHSIRPLHFVTLIKERGFTVQFFNSLAA
jgi:hypothetical protein